jgi:hypothetical protein
LQRGGAPERRALRRRSVPPHHLAANEEEHEKTVRIFLIVRRAWPGLAGPGRLNSHRQARLAGPARLTDP